MAAANPSASGAKEKEVATSAATAAAAVMAELVLMEVSATDTNRSVHVETGSAPPWEDVDTGAPWMGRQRCSVAGGTAKWQEAKQEAGWKPLQVVKAPSYTSWSSTNSNNSNNIYKRNKNKK